MLFAVLNVMLMPAVLVVLPNMTREDLALDHAARFILVRAGEDSWDPMEQAFDYTRRQGPKLVYDEVFFDRDTKFQYPLSTLLPAEAYAAVAEGDPFPIRLLDVVSWVSVWLTALFVALIFLRSLETYAPDYAPSRPAQRFLLGALVAALTLSFYPVAKAFTLGQIQTWINFLFTFLVWLWLTNRPVAAGAVGGLICAIKPQLGVLLVWGLLRRRWGFCASFASTLGLIGIATLLMYGLADNLNYLDVLSYISRRGEAYYPNQSVNGLLNRLLDNGNNASFEAGQFPPFDAAVYAGTITTSILVLAAALFWRSSEHHRAPVLDLLIAGLSSTIASPIAWEHHYGVLPAIFAVAIPASLRWPVYGRWTLPVLAGLFAISAHFLNTMQKAAGHPLLTPAQSYLFAAAVGVLVTLYLLRRAQAADLALVQQPANSTASGAEASASA